jgi:hypothetical protein
MTERLAHRLLAATDYTFCGLALAGGLLLAAWVFG